MANGNTKEKSEKIIATFNDFESKRENTKNGKRLRLKEKPKTKHPKSGKTDGIECFVQLFDENGNEVPIDPHRIIVNPPICFHKGEDGDGNPILEEDPEGVFWEVLWRSVEEAPHPEGWGV